MRDQIDGIRHPDLPRHKEAVMSALYGEVLGFIKDQALAKGKEYETQNKEIFECSQKIIWIDQLSPTHQMTIVFNSVQMSIEYGYVQKNPKEVLHREKLEGLRYLISPGTEIELNESSRSKFDKLFANFKKHFQELALQKIEVET